VKFVDQYKCVKCDTDLAPERMVEVLPLPSGEVQVRYVCECDGRGPLAGRYKFVGTNLVELIGSPMNLPWRAPTMPQVVTDDHPDMVMWRWELDRTQSVEEFVEWLSLTSRQSETSPHASEPQSSD